MKGLFGLALAATTIFVQSASSQEKVVESFRDCVSSMTGLPCGWRTRDRDVSMYSVEEEKGNHFLSADSRGRCASIGKEFRYDVEKFPLLSWRWRVHALPEGGREDIKKGGDSGAAVYVIFNGIFGLNKMIKYVWSSSLPVGTLTKSPWNKRTKIVVLRSGPEDTGRWQTETVDVLADYERLFGGDPPEARLIAIMSDADNTESRASADYDDIVVKAGPVQRAER